MAVGLSLLSAGLLVLAFPNFALWYLAWIAFVPLLYVLTSEIRPWQSFLVGEIFGIGYFYGTCYWITYSMIHYGDIPTALAYLIAVIPVSLVALFPATFAFIVHRLVKKLGLIGLLAAPFCWAAVEYLKFNITGINWNGVGYSQSFQAQLVWPARFGGVFLISALVMLPSVAITWWLRERNRRAQVGLVAILLFCKIIYLLGFYVNASPSAPQTDKVVEVVAVQALAPVGSTSAALSKALSQQLRMSAEGAAKVRARNKDAKILVVWPETPYSFDFDNNNSLRQNFGEFTKENQIYLLLNGNTRPSDSVSNNSIIVFGPTGQQVGQYNKIHLLPFGEYVPMRNYIPFIDRIPALAGDFMPADKYSTISIENVNIGADICFESVFPDVTREMSKAGAEVFINIADDAWFGPTPIVRQHLNHVAMRSIETGIPTIRVANTGISVYIDGNGQMSDETPSFETAIRYWQIAPTQPKLTVYTRVGDLFAWLTLVITFLLLGLSFKQAKTRPTNQ